MKQKSQPRIRAKCPYIDCSERSASFEAPLQSPDSGPVVSFGSYRRSSDSKRIRRYRCLKCRRTFSASRLTPYFRQQKRKLNPVIYKLFSSCMSARRIARHLGINRKTVTRKLLYLAEQAALHEQKQWAKLKASGQKIQAVQFDEMETFEWTKCKPLSIPMVVEEGTRRILGFKVASMPAKGPLAEISRAKYGKREDKRAEKTHELFSELKEILSPQVKITSDENPRYPKWIKTHFPDANHIAVKGREGCVVGQGELKKIGFDLLPSGSAHSVKVEKT